MSESLNQKKCIPCEEGAAPLSSEEAGTLLPQAEGWEIVEGHTLFRHFTFPNYAKSFAFISDISALAEQEGHHPDISFGWGYATIALQTHSIGGLHENDFIMAAKINEIER